MRMQTLWHLICFTVIIVFFGATDFLTVPPLPLEQVADREFGEVDRIGDRDHRENNDRLEKDRDDKNDQSDRDTLGRKASFITLLSNGHIRNNVDIAIVGDGYDEADNRPGGSYDRHSRIFMKKFFKYEPFKKYKKKFNVYRVRCISRKSGGFGNYRNNTLFRCRYGRLGIGRLLTIGNKRAVFRYAKRAPEYDIIIVMVNSRRYGGSGSKVYGRLRGKRRTIPAPVYAAGSSSGLRIVMHELGHSLANLADEYVDTRIAHHYSRRNIALKPNVDTTDNLRRIKWRKFFRYPGVKGVIGAYEGAYYRKYGVFRPQRSCMMRSLGYPFCHVCRKELVKAIFKICGKRFDENQYHLDNPVGKGLSPK